VPRDAAASCLGAGVGSTMRCGGRARAVRGWPRVLKSIARPEGDIFGGSFKKMSENEARPPAPPEEQLSRIIGECEARLAEYAQLAAHVRHEINNPLTGLIGQAQLLLREELSDTARRRVQTIEHLANRIRDTVASLREIQSPPPTPRASGGLNPDSSKDPSRH
jgi:signal transduction histidine kinase